MKIGIISDIHSNIIAFKAVTDKLASIGCDEYFLLGDFVSDTPYTRETLDYLYEWIDKHPCYLLRGNREEYMLGQRKAEKENSEDKWIWNSASGNLLFAYAQLTNQDLDFFERLPITFTYTKPGYPSITCCHGSPVNARELLQLDGENTKEWLNKIDTDYLICAHTHLPGGRSVNGRFYFNPGCVGISIHDAGFAQCMFLEDGYEAGKKMWKPTFLKVPYDNHQVVHDICVGGLLEKAPWFINSNILTLLTGVDVSAELVRLARSLAEEAGEEVVWPHIQEKYFEEAAEILGIPDYRKEHILNEEIGG